LKLARLLSAARRDAQAAIAEYDAVLARDPNNAEAHEGLAQAWAWVGDRDRALHHANLARRFGSDPRETARLRGDLERGREYSVGPIARGLVQSGERFRGSKAELRGVVVGARARGDVTPFVSLGLEAGFEDYFRSRRGDQAKNNQAAGYFELDGEYRLSPKQRVELGVGYHALTATARDVVGRGAFVSEGERFVWRAGFARTLRFDSFAALAGESVAGDPIGAARENRFYGRFERPGETWSASIEPYAGWVSARRSDANPFVGLRGEIGATLGELSVFRFRPFYRANVLHYRDAAFGLDPTADDPAPGGYFSPQLFVEQVPGLAIEGRLGRRHELDLSGGPAAQFVDEGNGIRFELGGQGRFAYSFALRESFIWSIEANFMRIGSAYTRGEATTGFKLLF
jgi:cellulose synthase operon protein C